MIHFEPVAAEHAERKKLYDDTRDLLLFGDLEGRGNPVATLRFHVGIAQRPDCLEAGLDAEANALGTAPLTLLMTAER
jgi:hypothetical protein